MNASMILHGARRKAHLSQRELARRAGVPQASVSRIERGVVSPTVVTLERLLAVCGDELSAVPRATGDVDRTLITERLKLTPEERLRANEREWNGVEAFRRVARRAE